MAFEDITPEEEYKKYWTPDVKGQNIEGNIIGLEKDDFGNDRIILDVGKDEEGKILKTTLPGHASLKRYYNKVDKGDYIRVTLINIRERKNGQNPQKIYKVEVDPERFVRYGN